MRSVQKLIIHLYGVDGYSQCSTFYVNYSRFDECNFLLGDGKYFRGGVSRKRDNESNSPTFKEVSYTLDEWNKIVINCWQYFFMAEH